MKPETFFKKPMTQFGVSPIPGNGPGQSPANQVPEGEPRDEGFVEGDEHNK